MCGAEVHRNALACRECGADHNSGWREDAVTYDGLDLPDEEFDYDEFVKREFGGGGETPRIKTVWWITWIILIVGLLVAVIAITVASAATWAAILGLLQLFSD